MRLINTGTYALEEYFNDFPEYAILSHTWGRDEVTFQDWQDLASAQKKKGFWKIRQTCIQARHDGLHYAWVDTSCIDKTSSSELSEAINSMYEWYRGAQVCYAYLEDVDLPDQPRGIGPGSSAFTSALGKVKASRWFARGWTLQELLAPYDLKFYSSKWKHLGDKHSIAGIISDATGIDRICILEPGEIHKQSVACRMSWMAKRKTTRIEDTAYCLLGIFDINMPLLYGEGHKAFLRLQQEIIRVSNDQTLFCWQDFRRFSHHPSHADPNARVLPGVGNSVYTSRRATELNEWTSILAPDPTVFAGADIYFPPAVESSVSQLNQKPPLPPAHMASFSKPEPYEVTNFGLRISLPVIHASEGIWVLLDVVIKQPQSNGNARTASASRVLLPLHKHGEVGYSRIVPGLLTGPVPQHTVQNRQQLYVDFLSKNQNARSDVVVWDPSADKLPRRLFLTFSHPVDDLCKAFGRLQFEPRYCAATPPHRGRQRNCAAVLTGVVNEYHLLVLQVGFHGIGLPKLESDANLNSRSGLENQVPRATSNGDDPAGLWHVGASPESRPPWMDDDLLRIDVLPPSYVGTWPPSVGLYGTTTWVTDDGDVVCHVTLASPSGSVYKISTWLKDETQIVDETEQQRINNIRKSLFGRFDTQTG